MSTDDGHSNDPPIDSGLANLPADHQTTSAAEGVANEPATMAAGSPFLQGTAQAGGIDPSLGSPLTEMAAGGLLSAAVLIPFSTVSLLIFPIGGVMIGALGLAASILGLGSQRPRLATLLAGAHLLFCTVAFFRLFPF
jgi:hypothetical protein